MKKKGIWAALGLALLVAAVLASVLLRRNEPRELTSFAMGSFVKQTVYGGGDQAASQAASAVTELEKKISWRVEGSDIDLLNRSAGEGGDPVPVSQETWGLLNVCLRTASAGEGAFDPTIAPVSRLWDFDGEPKVPGEAELSAANALVGWEALTLPGEGLAALSGGASLDLGAVGKGAACDTVIGSWKKNGVEQGVVAVGGSVGLFGSKPGNALWTVAVRDPAEPSVSASLGVLRLPEGSVSTSGSYEKTFTENGKTYHHLLDPKTGYPAESGLVSVTVWTNSGDGEDGAVSDALSTACFVLGYEKSLPLLREFSAEAVFVTEDCRVIVTDGLKDAFALISDRYEPGEGGGP